MKKCPNCGSEKWTEGIPNLKFIGEEYSECDDCGYQELFKSKEYSEPVE